MSFGIDLIELIRTVGYIGIIAIIFAESGLFFGFFLPGDSLLLTAGLLAARGELNLWHSASHPRLRRRSWAITSGTGSGKRPARRSSAGRIRFSSAARTCSAAKAFYEKHGGKTITIARFMPFIRTFAPIVAGAVEMDYRRFMFFNLMGGLLWAVGVTLAGYFLGQWMPPEVLDKYFLIILVVVILVSASPAMIHAWKEYRHEAWAWVVKHLERIAGETAGSDGVETG